MRAPHSAQGGQSGNNGYLGEDLDVLAEYTYSRLEDTNPRSVCWPVIDELTANEDRITGDRSAFWDERNYLTDAGNIKAATLLVHGNADFNVMTKNAAQLWDVLKRNNVPRQFYFHQLGHTNPLPDEMANRWFTKYLWGQDNGVQDQPKSWVVREPDQCPARTTTTTAAATDSTTLTVADAGGLQVGNALTIPDNPSRTITAIAGNTLTLSGPVTVASGVTVSLACGNANPTPYADWPDPATADATLRLRPGGSARGGLTFSAASSPGAETLTDDATINASALMNAAVLAEPARLSDGPAQEPDPDQWRAAGVARRGVQQARELQRRARLLPGGRGRRHDRHARLDRSGEPQLGLTRPSRSSPARPIA